MTTIRVTQHKLYTYGEHVRRLQKVAQENYMLPHCNKWLSKSLLTTCFHSWLTRPISSAGSVRYPRLHRDTRIHNASMSIRLRKANSLTICLFGLSSLVDQFIGVLPNRFSDKCPLLTGAWILRNAAIRDTAWMMLLHQLPSLALVCHALVLQTHVRAMDMFSRGPLVGIYKMSYIS